MEMLKSFLPGTRNSTGSNLNQHLEPEIGFKLNLQTPNTTNKSNEPDKNIPELNVLLIAARHLPSTFGFKTVQGYIVKVKLFPGSTKFDSNIETTTWPKFNENFKFQLGPAIKSSFKSYTKSKYSYENIPEQIFSGHFVVFTMYALLELPPGNFNRFKGTYRSLRERSSSILQKISEQNSEVNNAKAKLNDKEKPKPKETEIQSMMTKSETKRNIGSVTCYLEPTLFKQNPRNDQYETDEIWLPIKDLTITSTIKSPTEEKFNISTSTKGQLEIILELRDADYQDLGVKSEPESKSTSRHKWKSHYADIKQKIKTAKTQTKQKTQILKVSTSKMRCSIRVKDEFEQSAGMIYLKTSVFEQNTLIGSWKSENFLPSMSCRWDLKESTIIVPLNKCLSDDKLTDLLIKSTVATKNKMGKKIVLGTITIAESTNKQSADHFKAILSTKNQPSSMWHNFL